MGSVGGEVVKGVEQDDLVMPVIDFSKFIHGTSEEKARTAYQTCEAFKTSGFLYLSNHGIPPEMVSEAFDKSAKFFARPQEQKDALAWTTPEANRGYVVSGREKVTNLTDAVDIAALRANAPDLKETIEIGRDDEPSHPNQWPSSFDNDGVQFTQFMQSFFLKLKDLHIHVMRAIAVGMLGGSSQEHFFDPFTSIGDNTLRLLHYPSVKKSVFANNPHQVRAGEHSDYGSITLLFQDDVGGLEVKSPRGTWVRATPIPGTIVVNAGDLLMRWSNDMIKSTKHRVVQPPTKPTDNNNDDDDDSSDSYPTRYSIAYFCNPDFIKTIEALPGTFVEPGMPAINGLTEKKYESVNSGAYLARRLAETF